MAAALPARAELTPEQRAEVRESIQRLKVLAGSLKTLPNKCIPSEVNLILQYAPQVALLDSNTETTGDT